MHRNQETAQADLFKRSQERTYTVHELTAEIRSLLENRFALVRVVGEVSGMSVASSGHVYFNLKDPQASLGAVLFRAAAARLPVLPAEGEEVECLGRLTLYEQRGRTQLVVEWLMPRGAGALGLRFLQLKAKLQAEGLFDASRKRPLPALPRTVGVVTSPTGAAVRDILKVLDARFPSIPVLVCPVRVQGEGAADEIAQAIRRMGDGHHGDVLIVGRGGGSAEDLWAFNEEAVVRAIAATAVPVVSAVGHEVDVVLSDLVADVRAPTPSVAAQWVVPERAALVRDLGKWIAALRRAETIRLEGARRRLSECARRIRDPRHILASHRLRLDDAVHACEAAVRRRLVGARSRLGERRLALARADPQANLRLWRARLEDVAARLARAASGDALRRKNLVHARREALLRLSPLAVLARGYAIVQDREGRAIRSFRQVVRGDTVRMRLHEGSLDGRVEQAHPSPEETGHNGGTVL